MGETGTGRLGELLEPTRKGRQYSEVGGTGAAVISGGGCAGSPSLRYFGSRRGSVRSVSRAEHQGASQLAPEWTAYLSARNREEQRIAGWFLLAKLPGAAVDLVDPHLAYVRPVGSVRSFQGRWPDWLMAPRGARLPPVEPPAVSGDQVCFGSCGPGKFPFRLPDFIAVETAQAAAERGRFAPSPTVPGVSSVWEELLDYMRAHPRDPRAPEALYWLIHVSQYGTGHNRSGYRAFNLLHERYPSTTWAKQSKYYYD